MILPLGSAVPRVADDSWIAPTATVIGDAVIASQVGIWYNAVIRADEAPISIGEGTNIQDGCVVHADPGIPATIGSGVSVGHNAVLHGCTVADNVLVGMGAIIMNGAHVGEDSLVAAGALIPEKMIVPARSLVAGVPAKIRRTLTDPEVDTIRANAENYRAARVRHAAAHTASTSS